jgi:hypothetical protein
MSKSDDALHEYYGSLGEEMAKPVIDKFEHLAEEVQRLTAERDALRKDALNNFALGEIRGLQRARQIIGSLQYSGTLQMLDALQQAVDGLKAGRE